ncbi:putative ribonuclease H-like domain-containing protein, partial [Tanacetum coccineum]
KTCLKLHDTIWVSITILNTIDHLGKFDGKADEGFYVGYSTNSKAFRVFNSRTRIVKENPHLQFSENTSNIARSGPNWLFDIVSLTKSMNYKLVVAGNQSNGSVGTKVCDNAGKAIVETVPGKDYILLPLWTQDPPFSSSSKDSPDVGFKPSGEEEKKDAKDPRNEGGNTSEEGERVDQEKDANVNSTNNINTVSPIVNVAGIEDNAIDENIVYGCADDLNIPNLEEIGRFSDAEDDGAEADMTNLDTHILVSPIPTTRIHKDHPVWTLVDLPHGKRAIGTKWVSRNKKDKTGIVTRTKARLVAQGHTQEEGIDYDEVFAPVSRIEAIRLFLAYASYKDFKVLKTQTYLTEFQRGQIDKTLFIKRDQGDILIVQVYVDDIIFGSTKKKLCTEFEKMMHKKFQMSSMGELTFFLGLQVKQKEDGIFISQDKYVTEILKKFGFSDVKTANTPMETHKPLLKDADGEDVDEHMYRSMIGSLMYLTSSRPDIMFAICQPQLGLWYPKDLPFDLVAYTDSDYAGASLDRKSTTGGYQFLGCRLISWQCKKQTVVANSITKAEYVAASSCCGQVLWIQNQLLDYGYNFMHTKIYIDNESIICIVRNPVFRSKKKHIEIRHRFIRDSNEKKLIQMIKIHTDKNIADLLTKAFDPNIISDLKFADTHNLVAFLSKPAENEGFEQIVDFLNANPIKYDLTINPTIYTLCIKQFWDTVKVKSVNGKVQLQALVDKKKVIITESTIKRYLKLEDTEGTDCLPNATIFK